MTFHRIDGGDGRAHRFVVKENITWASIVAEGATAGVVIHFVGGPSLEIKGLPQQDAFALLDSLSKISSLGG